SLGQGCRQGQEAALGEAPQQQPQLKIGRFLKAAGRSLQQFFTKQVEGFKLSHSVQALGQGKQPVQRLDSGSDRISALSAMPSQLTAALRGLRPVACWVSFLNTNRQRYIHCRQSPQKADASMPRSIWVWIQAAIAHFFGTDLANRRLGGFAEPGGRLSFNTDEISDDKDGLALPSSSFAMVLIPGLERWVITVLRVIRRGINAVIPWIRGDRPLALPTPSVTSPPQWPSSMLLQSQGLGPMTAPASFCSMDGLLQGQDSAWDDWRRLIAPESAAQSPLQTTLIEVKATVIGYVESPLRVMGKWLDGAMRWLEDAVLGMLSGLWRFVQSLKRHWMNSRSQASGEGD
ncbi:MAG: hypothetical protein O2890_09655, partial [Cyanobacteria bacterium]|nr:hypothetical protein [Cyanobacteriota bacterium]